MNHSGHFIWDLDPVIFVLGPLAPRYYGLLFAAGFLMGYLLLKKPFAQAGLGEKELVSLFYHLTFGALIGARLGHVLFYHPGSYLADPLSILRIWEGGLASHGGALGVIAAVILFSHRHRGVSVLWLADSLAPAIALTAFCVRLGNFFNSEILGTPSSLSWAVVFARVDMIPRHPAMLYEAFCYLGLFLFFLLSSASPAARPGARIGVLLIWIFSARFLVEFFKEQHSAFESTLPLNMGQILSIPLIFLGVLLAAGVFTRRARTRLRPGRASAP